ncbi:zinc-finger domain-containing protein [Sphingobacterium paramultivorum]|uniref:Zinc-finger domain-containing protein n=1 Tax=Sphingobacterium paramultivorum TaxID=2886510 RepID=A0A7G5E4B4_9SPHI|nr:zinc-finger domain-containing protein [Sphingobacterium paramultivorum]
MSISIDAHDGFCSYLLIQNYCSRCFLLTDFRSTTGKTR